MKAILLQTKMINRSQWHYSFIGRYVNLVKNYNDSESEALLDSELFEREGERAKSKSCFMALSGGTTAIVSAHFGRLFVSMGTTYCEEAYVKTLKTLNRLTGANGKIQWEDFSEWYIGWLFGYDEDVDSDEDGIGAHSDGNKVDISRTCSEGWGNLFAEMKNKWKCQVFVVLQTTVVPLRALHVRLRVQALHWKGKRRLLELEGRLRLGRLALSPFHLASVILMEKAVDSFDESTT